MEITFKDILKLGVSVGATIVLAGSTVWSAKSAIKIIKGMMK